MEPLTRDKFNLLVVVAITAFTIVGCLLVAFIVELTQPADLKRTEQQPGSAQTGNGDQAVAVLLFHAVENAPATPNIMSSDTLEATFQAIKECGYHPIGLEQFHAFIDGRAGVPPKAVLITFDDGYRDIYEIVYPLTKKYNYPAVVFTVSKWFDPYPRPEHNRPHLNVSEAVELVKSGLWSVGGHSYEGHRQVEVSGNQTEPYYVARAWNNTEGRHENKEEYYARVWSDISLDRAALERAGIKGPRDFAFPYGAFNSDVIEMLNKAGYVYLYMTEPGLNRRGQDPSYIYRISAGQSVHETMALLGWYFSRK